MEDREYLLHVQRAIREIQDHTAGLSREDYERDSKTQRAVERNPDTSARPLLVETPQGSGLPGGLSALRIGRPGDPRSRASCSGGGDWPGGAAVVLQQDQQPHAGALWSSEGELPPSAEAAPAGAVFSWGALTSTACR